MNRTAVRVAIGVAAALGTLLIGGCAAAPGGRPLVVVSGEHVIGAAIDVKCADGNTYTVSTGNNKGDCKAYPTHPTTGAQQGAICADSAGNGATVSCSSGCSESKGSGSCTVKARAQ